MHSTHHNRIMLLLTVVGWVVAILVIPLFVPVKFPDFRIAGIYVHSDYIVHVLLFVLLVITLKAVGVPIMRVGVMAVLLVAAIVAEAWQKYIPLRTYNLSDLISNVFGVILGYAIYLPMLVRKMFKNNDG